MKVLHINLQKGWRGGEQQLGYLMSELKNKPIEQFLLCRKGSEVEDFAKQNDIVYLGLDLSILKGISNSKTVADFVLKNQIDILHCNDSKGLGVAVWSKILFGNHAKLLLHRHVIFPIKGVISKQIKYSPKYIDKVICVSSEAANIIRKTTYNTNITVIPTMTDVHFNYKNEQLLPSFGVDVSKKIVGYIAALTFEKDHYTFLKSAQLISQKNTDVHFAIIGSGKLEPEIKEYAQTLGLAEKVSFLGFVPQANKLIPEIDVLLFTSTQEGCPTTIIDFFVAKKPVVCTDYPGSTDLIQENITGFLCPIKNAECLAEKTLAILSDNNQAAQIAKKAHNVAIEKFSVQGVTDRIYAVYQELLQEN